MSSTYKQVSTQLEKTGLSLEHLDLALHHGHLFFAGRYVYRSSV